MKSAAKRLARPKVTLKFARTLDGYIATKTGDSKWISSPQSRRFAHRLRSRHDAVLVGVNTVLKDNPRLDVRLVRGRNPVKIILDSRLRTPLTARLLQKDAKRTIIAVTHQASPRRIKQFEKLGVRILALPGDRQGKVDLKVLLQRLSELRIKTLLVEGGSKVITAFLREKLVDRVLVITAPKIIGRGINSVGVLQGKRIRLSEVKVFQSGEDFVVEGKV